MQAGPEAYQPNIDGTLSPAFLATPPAKAIAITISVNGIQQQTFTLGDAPNFNVGIIDPIVLPGLANCFKVTFRFVSAQGQELVMPARRWWLRNWCWMMGWWWGSGLSRFARRDEVPVEYLWAAVITGFL